MFQALYNSLSGLFSFSRSLETVSNNITNMNTPGFRGSDSFFENVLGGRGTQINGEGMRLAPGDLRQTGTASDLAILGNGYFVLRDESGNLHYSRAGQFRFDGDGFLRDTVSNYQVMAMDAAGNLSPVHIGDSRSLDPVASTRIGLGGNLSPTTTTHTVPNVRVFDANGVSHTLSLTFTNTNALTPNSWSVSVSDSSGTVIGSGELRFAANGDLQAGFSSFSVNLGVQGGTLPLTFDFGASGSSAGSTQLTGVSTTLGAREIDGRGELGLTGFSFNNNGLLQLNYGSERRDGPQLALAQIANESSLSSEGGRLFSNVDRSRVSFGHAGSASMGRIAGGSLELSNVDLTQEFADMIVIQRGYQASSRVLTVTNEMLENLYNSTRGG